jgi:hypothetical protein
VRISNTNTVAELQIWRGEGRIISASEGERKDQKHKLLLERRGLCKYLEMWEEEFK